MLVILLVETRIVNGYMISVGYNSLVASCKMAGVRLLCDSFWCFVFVFHVPVLWPRRTLSTVGTVCTRSERREVR